MRNVLKIGRVPLAGPLTLFLLGGLLGLPASYDPLLSVPWLLWLAAGAALYITTVLLVPRGGERLAAGPALAGLAGALLLMAQYRHLGFDRKFGLLARLGGWLSAPFPALPLPHLDANAAAATLAGAVPLACGLAWAARGRARLLWLGCAGLTGLGVLLTASRGAWAALAAAALLGALAFALTRAARPRRRLLGPRAGRVLAGLGLATLALAALGLLAGPAGLARALNALAVRAADRLTVYRNDFFLALDLPFSGIGPGATFGEVYSRLQLLIVVPLIGYAHNLLLGAWLAQGALGLLGLLGLAGGAALRIGRGLAHGAGPLAWGAALGAATMLLHGLTDAPQYDTSWTTMLMGFALLGLALGLADAGPRTQDRGQSTQGAGPRDDELQPAAHAPSPWFGVLGAAFRIQGLGFSVRAARLGVLGSWFLVLGSGLLVVLLGPALGAAGCANVAAVLRTHAQLRPGLSEPQRAELRARAVWWSDQGLGLDPHSTAALKQRGLLAADAHDFAGAVRLLTPAFDQRPADQSLRKALGYAELWSGQIEPGVALLSGLTYIGEVRKELAVWPVAWRQRQREDLARRAEQAAVLLR